mgnify:CR=1 FL=1
MSRQEISLFILIITEYKILAEYIKDNLDIMIEYEKGRIDGVLWSMYALNIISSNEKNRVTKYLNSL